MCAHSPAFPASPLTSAKTPSGALYAVQVTDDPSQHQFSHPLLTPITGASLLMSLSAYNTAGIGMLSTVFSAITGIIGLWGLWTVRPNVPLHVVVSETRSVRLPLLAPVGARNLGQTNALPPSSSATNPQRQKSRKVRGGSTPECACCSFLVDNYIAIPGEYLMFRLVVYANEKYAICHAPCPPSS